MAYGPHHIVVVDDSADFLEVARTALEDEGYSVFCASDPGEAMRHMAERRPDLLVTDLMMGSLMAGFELTRAMRRDEGLADVPVLVVSAAEGRSDLKFSADLGEQMAGVGIEAFLGKPVAPSALVEKVRELLAESA